MSSYNHILTKAGNGLDSYSLEQRSFWEKKKRKLECTNINLKKEHMRDKTCKVMILNITGKLHYDCQMFPIIT